MSASAVVPLDRDLLPYAEGGMPEGVLELAVQRAGAAAATATGLLGTEVVVDALSVAVQLHLPAVMAASYGSKWWPTPPAPRPAPGGGWFNAEMGGAENARSFARLLETMPADADAAAIAATAQDWRLPVCDYRPLADPPPWRSVDPPAHPDPVATSGRDSGPATRRPALTGLRVLDLTSMWAGPLATWLLTRLGADVVKIEPPVRPDGFRAINGRGVWPGGRARRGDGSRSAVFNALNSGKKSWAVDGYEHGSWLKSLAESADLVVDSFSPRVMEQLGLDRLALRLSMPAFPRGPLRNWVAYGTGVHALSGLGNQEDHGPTAVSAPAVTYPDPLAGLLGAVEALDAISGLGGRSGCRHQEATLAGSLEPLLDRPRRMRPAVPGTGAALLRAAIESGTMTPLEDPAGWHWYPIGPFRLEGSPELSPAPAHADAPPEGAWPWTP